MGIAAHDYLWVQNKTSISVSSSCSGLHLCTGIQPCYKIDLNMPQKCWDYLCLSRQSMSIFNRLNDIGQINSVSDSLC